MGEMKQFVGCDIIQSKDNKTIWLHQSKLIKHLERDFRQYINTERIYKTPAAPKTVIMRPQEGEPLITSKDQTIYRSGVGMLLYLIKHSRPDISNAVRELTKVLDGATQAHWKAMIRVIKYVLDTKEYALKLHPTVDKNEKQKFYLEGISDSEFAGDRDTSASVFGFILYFCGAPVSWKSKSGKSETL